MGSLDTAIFYKTDIIFDVVIISYNGGRNELEITLHKN